MKKVLTAVIALLLIAGLTAGVFASVGSERKVKVIKRQGSQTFEEHIKENHRVVKGAAAHRLAPNFWDNDWDKGSLSACTAAERAFLKTVTGLRSGVWYHIDLTTKTVQTKPFQNSSTTIGSTTTTTVKTETLDPYCVIETTVYTTVVTIKDVTYQIIGSVYDYSPLVLDLNNDDKIDVARNDWRPHAPKFFPQYAKFFDITGDGVEDWTEWMDKKVSDGLLVIPENGEVRNALQLFGTAGGYVDGYEKLAIICDKDNNGWVEGEELNGLKIWIDENNDAVCQPGELKELADYNISRISTKHNDFLSTYVTSDGKEHKMWDWWPAMMETRKFRN